MVDCGGPSSHFSQLSFTISSDIRVLLYRKHTTFAVLIGYQKRGERHFIGQNPHSTVHIPVSITSGPYQQDQNFLFGIIDLLTFF